MYLQLPLAAWWAPTILLCHIVSAAVAQTWPISSTGYTDAVQWDHYSYIIRGQRTFLFGGEMHPFRIPVPELWEDVLQKMKAMGMNSLSFYSHWGFHEELESQVDFSRGARNLARFLDYASESGLLVTARPGPYINGELSAGGFPLWLTTGAYGTLRSTGAKYTAAWTPYLSGVATVIAPYQIHRNGTVISYQIENEYPYQWENSNKSTPDTSAISYMKLLEANARENGIEIPLTANDVYPDKSWSTDYDSVGAGGDVNIHGVDAYPTCWQCNPTGCHSNGQMFVLPQFVAYNTEVAPNSPGLLPEFQGGKVMPLTGYPDGCVDQVGVEFRNIYHRNNIEERITAMSLYMTYGGTNWGWLGVPFLGSSYDYSAPINEDRSLRDSFFETKNLALFTRIAGDLPKTDRIAQGTNYSTDPAVLTSYLRNPDTGAGFYIARHDDSLDNSTLSFKLNVSTSLGVMTIPQYAPAISLSGHVAKILVTDFSIGTKRIIYSTTEVFTYVILDNKATLVLWGATGESGETYITGSSACGGRLNLCDGCENVKFNKADNGTIFSFTQGAGLSVATVEGVRVLFGDRSATNFLFAPTLNSNPLAPVNETVLVYGPYLVRSARIEASNIFVNGDTVNRTELEVFAPAAVGQIYWNGRSMSTMRTAYGSLKSSLSGPVHVGLPTLGPWVSRDSLPEVFLDYDDSGPAWVAANHNTTSNSKSGATTPFLYADDYGFHAGSFVYRGRFNGGASGALIQVQGGEAFGFSTYLNGQFLSAYPGSTSSSATLALAFPYNLLVGNGNNILTVIQDCSGHDEGGSATAVRGIINATLIGSASGFSSWRLAGAAGGSTGILLDPTRGIYNEGGWTAERLGWHLPGFDDSHWQESNPSDGFGNATVRFYRTKVPLAIPSGHDISVEFLLSTPGGNATTRVLLYVNGYQYGRFAPYVNSAYRFPVQPGILNFNGDNTIGLLVWAQSPEGARVDVGWNITEVRETSFNTMFDSGYIQPPWNETRLQYV